MAIIEYTASHTLEAGDANDWLQMNVGTANVLTVPKDATYDFAIPTTIIVEQTGIGNTTISPEDGDIDLHCRGGDTIKLGTGAATTSQWAVATLTKTAANKWSVTGDLTVSA